MNNTIINPHFSRPLSQGEALAVKGDMSGVTPIVRLFVRICPSAIFWFVVAVIINPIQRIAAPWALSHVFNKRFNGVQPTLAHCYPSAAIASVTRIALVRASRNHSVPRFVFGRSANTVFGSRLATPATTLPGDQATGGYGLFIPACASTKPHRMLAFVTSESENGQAHKPLAHQVVSNCLRNGYNPVSHFCTSIADLVRGLEGVHCTFQSLLFYHKLMFGQNAL